MSQKEKKRKRDEASARTAAQMEQPEVAPEVAEYVPAAQSTQRGDPLLSWYMPTLEMLPPQEQTSESDLATKFESS
jgi:hypothetical protein